MKRKYSGFGFSRVVHNMTFATPSSVLIDPTPVVRPWIPATNVGDPTSGNVCKKYFDWTEPVKIYEILDDMQLLNHRENYDRPLSPVCDRWIDLPGYAQRAPGWGWQRWVWPASGSNSMTILGNGFCEKGQTKQDTIVKLFDIKTARVAADPPNRHMQRGIDYEDKIAEIIEQEYDCKLIEMPMIFGGVSVRDGVLRRTPGWSQLGVSLDRVVAYVDDERKMKANAIVEIKCPDRITPKKWKSYYDQVQYQMMISGAPLCYLVQCRPKHMRLLNDNGEWYDWYSESGEDEMYVDPIPADPEWEKKNVATLIEFVNTVREYRRKNSVTYRHYLQRNSA